jgi:hypothetical protein
MSSVRGAYEGDTRRLAEATNPYHGAPLHSVTPGESAAVAPAVQAAQ